MSAMLTREEVIARVLPVLRSNGVLKAGLFGSMARGDAQPGSDVDILVECSPDTSLFGFVRLKLELEELLGTKVDLVEYGTIKPLLRERILDQEVRFHG